MATGNADLRRARSGTVGDQDKPAEPDRPNLLLPGRKPRRAVARDHQEAAHGTKTRPGHGPAAQAGPRGAAKPPRGNATRPHGAKQSSVVHPIGSSFESFLAEEGLLAGVDEAAVKEVIAWQVAQAMLQRGLSKTAMAGAMQTSRTQLNRLLDPTNTGVALHTLYRAAAVLGKRLRVELTDAD